MFDCILNSEETDVFPLTNIPIECEDEPIHTAENGYMCGDPTCICASQEVQG